MMLCCNVLFIKTVEIILVYNQIQSLWYPIVPSKSLLYNNNTCFDCYHLQRVDYLPNGNHINQPMVLVSGNSSSHPASFILLGIPGLESFQYWIAFLFCAMYAVAVVGNITLLCIIRIDHTLHKPMYLFLAMLAITDLVLSSSTQPKMLVIFCFMLTRLSTMPASSRCSSSMPFLLWSLGCSWLWPWIAMWPSASHSDTLAS